MERKYPHLFSPYKIRNFTLKNRLVAAPIGSWYFSPRNYIFDYAISIFEHKAFGGAAAVTVGWTDPLRRQRVVVRWQLRPGEALLRAHYRFTNLNPRPLGFSPWSNMFFGYADDLQYIIPAAQVAPHGFNDGSLDLWYTRYSTF